MTKEQSKGDWRGLESVDQSPRYEIISDLLKRFRVDRRVLDVGCGSAVLRSWLRADSRYIGIEISRYAVDSARKAFPAADIIHTSAEQFASSEKYQSIIFNEMLYYSRRPTLLLNRFSRMLEPTGAIICSIFQKRETISLGRKIWSLICRREACSNLDCEVIVRNFMRQHNWRILEDRSVYASISKSEWHVWLANPNGGG